MVKSVAIIPAYNEEVALGSIILRTLQYVDEVIIVNDGSDDKTVDVAKLAGVPQPVVNRARVILEELESSEHSHTSMPYIAPPEDVPDEPLQLSLTGALDDEIIDTLKNIDTDTLTPLEALTTLHQLVQKARRE